VISGSCRGRHGNLGSASRRGPRPHGPRHRRRSAPSAIGVLPFLLSHLAVDGWRRTGWTEADTAFHEAIDLAPRTGQRSDLGFALSRLAWLEREQGKDAACRAHASEARELAADIDLG